LFHGAERRDEQPVGCNLLERDENKLSFREAGVGNVEIAFVENECAVEKDVEVERAWAISNAGGSIAAEVSFDVEKGVEESSGGKSGLERNHGIDEARLLGKPHRLCGVKGRAADDAADGVEAISGGGEGDFRRTGRTGDVGAHPDVSGLHDSRVARWGG
jgi:hypothetical protein